MLENSLGIGKTMKKRKMLILAIASALIIGGTIVAVKNKDLFSGIAQQKYQSTEEKQLAYLKKHKKYIEDYIKSLNPKIESVQIDWNSMTVEQIGNGTPQGAGFNLSLKGTFNHIKDSDFTIDFWLKKETDIPSIDLIGMLNPPSILKNGGWDRYE